MSLDELAFLLVQVAVLGDHVCEIVIVLLQVLDLSVVSLASLPLGLQLLKNLSFIGLLLLHVSGLLEVPLLGFDAVAFVVLQVLAELDEVLLDLGILLPDLGLSDLVGVFMPV